MFTEPTPRPTRLSFLLELNRYFLMEWLDIENRGDEEAQALALRYSQALEDEMVRLYDPVDAP